VSACSIRVQVRQGQAGSQPRHTGHQPDPFDHRAVQFQHRAKGRVIGDGEDPGRLEFHVSAAGCVPLLAPGPRSRPQIIQKHPKHAALIHELPQSGALSARRITLTATGSAGFRTIGGQPKRPET